MMELSKFQRYQKSDKGKKAQAKSAKKYMDRLRGVAVNSLGDKCVKCGFSDIRALQIDHINGGGSKERKSLVSAVQFYKGVLKSFLLQENKYQLLCANCNWIKRFENNEVKKQYE